MATGARKITLAADTVRYLTEITVEWDGDDRRRVSALNSAIDELIPARLRGRIDLIINGCYWVGAAFGAGSSLLLLSGRWVAIDVGRRLGFGIGAVLYAPSSSVAWFRKARVGR